MQSHNEIFSSATQLHQQGRLAEAVSLYQQVLRGDRKNVGAANLLGVALMQAGRLAEAATAIRRALEIDPHQSTAHYNLGAILQSLNRHAEAVDHYQRAIALSPKDAQSHNNLGVTLKALGRYEDAAASYRKALGLKPDYGEAHTNLATVLCSLENYEEAIRQSEKALVLNPNLTEAHVNIGNALRALERTEEAVQAFDRAIASQPDRPEGYESAGNALMERDLTERAVPYFEKAAALKQTAAGPYFKLAICLYAVSRQPEAFIAAEKGFAFAPANADDEVAVGTFLQEANRHDEALAHFERALELEPDSTSAHFGCGRTLIALQRYEEALFHTDRSIGGRSGQDRALYNKSQIHLSLGRFPEGWKLYENRFSEKVKISAQRSHSAPRWDGKKITGTLAVWGEQGLGDQILYASIIPDVLAHAGSVVLEVEPRLIGLLSRSFPEVQFRSLAEDPKNIRANAHVPMGGLGEFFRQRPEDFPRQAYLLADKDRAAGLRASLHADKKLAVGISWRSANPKFGMHKTAQLRDFSPLFTRPDVQVVDLQYGDTAAEIEAVRGEFGVAVRHLDEIDNTNDIDGLAALIDACDVVLTVSNTTAHIAGALGKPVWVMVPHGQGRLWYWFHERADSPWYPEMRICRQQKGQSWADLIALAVSQITDFVQPSKP